MAANLSLAGGGLSAAGKVDELRGLLRAHAAADSSLSSPSQLLASLFLSDSQSDGGAQDGSTLSSSSPLTRDKFCATISNVRGVRARFTAGDLAEIFNFAAEEIGGGSSNPSAVSRGAVVDYFSTAMSKARMYSIKLRSVVMQDFEGVDEYKRAFSSMSTSNSNVVDVGDFTNFAEDMLDLEENTITESEAKAMYAIVDVDKDGEVSLEDFLAYMMGTLSAEAATQLKAGNEDVIVDIKVSTNANQEASLRQQGYTQVLPEGGGGATVAPDFGSFGRGQSIWIWRRKQGTCSGRLRPITDLQLDSGNYHPSSNSVLIGYQCVATPLGAHQGNIWYKRALAAEEEKDALIDIKVTVGKAKNPADRIWASPGVGWVLVSQGGSGANFGPRGLVFNGANDAFVWIRPLRTRTADSALVTVANTVASMSEETRHHRLVVAVRWAIRHHVPLSEMRRLAKLQLEGAPSSSSSAGSKAALRSDRMFDYAALFHAYSSESSLNPGQGVFMKKSKFCQLLHDVGMNIHSEDMTRCYNYFDKDLNGKLSRVEFARVISLTGYEVDVAIERIRSRLLRNHSGSRGTNILRESRLLSHIFRNVNENKDSILSLDEILDLAARLEIFLTEDEARIIAKEMDVNGDDRIEEADFISFMRRQPDLLVKKAQRLHTAAATLRRWLINGSNTTSAVSISASDVQWAEFKSKHEKSTRNKFPGFLSSEDLLFTLSSLGVLLSGTEARELLLLVAPDQSNGQLRQTDLHAFMNRTCRTLGELVALMERDVLKSVVDLYRTHCAAIRVDGVPDSALADAFASAVRDLVKRMQDSQVGAMAAPMRSGAINAAAPQASTVSGAVHDVVSSAQIKAGAEASMGRVPAQGAGQMPNLEEYAALAALVGALVADEDTLGINAKVFIESMCAYIVSGGAAAASSSSSSSSSSVEQSARLASAAAAAPTSAVTLEVLCRDLRRMIREEAKAAGGGRTFDFITAFAAFDEEGSGNVKLSDFKKLLVRFQLIDKLPPAQVPALLECFDRSRKGYITYDDFLAFVESSRGIDGDDDDDYALDDDEADGDELLLGLSSNTPPTSITRNSDCDWLLWFLWRQACRAAPRDPENLLAELEAYCVAADKRQHGSDAAVGDISVRSFWQALGDKKLQGTMTRGQFDKGIKFLVHDGTGKDEDPMDYVSIAKYVVRMGRAFNSLVQQRRVVDEKKFAQLRASLKKELLEIDASSNSSNARGDGEDEDGPATPAAIGSRFERVLRRLDTNGDGMLTVPEFKLGLKRLKIRDEKRWTAAMVRRLFDESNTRTDGKLSISDFGKAVRGDVDTTAPGFSSGALAPAELSDDEEDNVFSLPKAATTDSALFRKASDILLELVPVASSSYSPGAVSAHCDAVRAAIRFIFQKADPAGTGLVTEDEFRIFARKSGLQTRLRVGELRKLVSKLRSRAGDASTEDGRLYSGRGHSSSASDAPSINYEKLCKLVGPGSESYPRSRVDALVLRLQEAAELSAAHGRSFLALCTLTDPLLTGRISETEFSIVGKMMGCPLTLPEVEMLREQIADLEVENKRENAAKGSFGSERDDEPSFSSSTRRPGAAKGVDYRQVNMLLETYQSSRPPTVSELNSSTMRNSRVLGALPSYAATGGVTRMPGSTIRGVPPIDISRTVPTPGGLFLTTPVHASSSGYRGVGASLSASTSRLGRGFGAAAGHGSLATAYDRGLIMLAEKIKLAGRRMQLSIPPLRHLQRRLENADSNGRGLVAEDSIQVILEDLGISLSPPDLHMIRERFGNLQGSVDYEALCAALGEANEVVLSGPLASASVSASASGFAAGAGGSFQATPTVARRMRELTFDGVDVRQAFADYDFDGNGVVEVRRFVEVVKRLSLLQTERQLMAAIESFTSLSDRTLVSYVDFCLACDRAEAFTRAADGDTGMGASSSLRSSSDRFVFGSGYDGLSTRSRDFSAAVEEEEPGYSYRGSARGDYSGRPPLGRTGSSASFGRSGGLSPPRISASQVGSRQWGSGTPLAQKGRPIQLAGDSWACSVCMYTENPLSAGKCLVCDSSDYSKKPRSGVTGVCKNCRFPSAFSDAACPMCGLSL